MTLEDEAAAVLAIATTSLGVIDYARLAATLSDRDASPALWQAVAHALNARREGEAWERYLGVTYPAEAPTDLPPRPSEN